jgi:hypothetical protein
MNRHKCVFSSNVNFKFWDRILQPTSDAMAKLESLRDRRSKFFNHLSMISEGVMCLQWVCVDKTPAAVLNDIIPGSEMYGNKVIMEFKGKDETHVNLAKDFKTFLLELQKYIKAHHTTGVNWNVNGSAGLVIFLVMICYLISEHQSSIPSGMNSFYKPASFSQRVYLMGSSRHFSSGANFANEMSYRPLPCCFHAPDTCSQALMTH